MVRKTVKVDKSELNNSLSQEGEATTTESKESEPSSSQETSMRPKRNTRKSVLYNSEDFEISMPGVKTEDDDEIKASLLDHNTDSQHQKGKRGKTLQTEINRPVKKRKVPGFEDDKPMAKEDEDDDVKPIEQPEVGANEEYIIDDSVMLQLGAETEIPHSLENEDDGPPRLTVPLREYDGPARLEVVAESEEVSFADDEDFDGAPQLESNAPLGKRRGRPKKVKELDELEEVEKKEKQPRIKEGRQKLFRVAGERVISKSMADRVSQFHVKLFEEDIEMTELGDPYATVINGCLAYLLRKERIIELLTNNEEIALIREGGWFLDKPPRLPPLVTHKACFAFCVDGSKLASIKDISNDDLKPWSSTGFAPAGEPVIKPNVRRHPVARVNNRLVPVKGDPRLAELHLTEYSAWLPRLLRLRKKIFYLSREGQIYGNVLILYDYTCSGEAPTVVNLPHGNDYLRSMVTVDTDDQSSHVAVADADNPFEEEIISGNRGGNFLRVRPTKLGWFHNKKLLLKYLINEPGLLDESTALNRLIPFLPPLVETPGVFVYFVAASFVANHLHHAGDGLSPWTVNPNGEGNSPRVRSTRRALIQDENGMFCLTREAWQNTGLCLVETLSVLARCPRLRKRVLYVQRNNSIVMGNVCYIYEYVREGPIPTIIKPSSSRGLTDQHAPETRNWVQVRKIKNTSNSGTGLNEDEQYIDVEDLAVVDEEEVIEDIIQDCVETQTIQENLQEADEYEELPEDSLSNGWDAEFDDDPLLQQDQPDPYFETPRVLETGHIYLTVRHKRIASTFDCVLEWIANTNVVEERGLLNYSKPGHPPIVRNARSYAFFVAGTAIFPHDINRDDFSPWSHNGTSENPTCYRTKVRKIGIICDDLGSQFQIKDIDYKSCPFHLVFLYSINPRDPRLRKKIYYMMETESRLVVSHALIMYDYNVEGPLPRLHGGYLKRFTRRSQKRAPIQIHDVDNDVSDISETEKECPFALPPQLADDGTMYLQLVDMEFWNDRNRQLHFLVNKPNLIEALGCLNNRVPALPPATSGKGGFVFFVDGCEVDSRNLTCDGLVPWSENSVSNPQGGTKRPKSSKQPLALNREGQLRVWKTPPMTSRNEHIEFQMHVYTATLPRCPRLKKKVIYVLKNGHQIGHSMIIYWFTESGEMPVPINLNSLAPEISAQRIPTAIREDARRLLITLPPLEVSKIIMERHGLTINPKTLYYIRRRDILSIQSQEGSTSASGVSYSNMKNEMLDQFVHHDWSGSGSQTDDLLIRTEQGDSGRGEEAVEIPGEDKNNVMHVVDEGSIQVAEEIQIGSQTAQSSNFMRSAGRNITLGEQLGMIGSQGGRGNERTPNPLLDKPMTSSGLVRGAQRTEALWRIAKSSFGTTNDNETFDMLWKMMLEKNEQRLLHNVHQTFGVEIIAGVVDGMENGEMIHLGEHGLDSQIVEENDVMQQERRTTRRGQNSHDLMVKDIEDEDSKIYLQGNGGVPKEEGNEEEIVEEEVHDHLLDEALAEGVIVEEEEVTNDEMVIVQQATQ